MTLSNTTNSVDYTGAGSTNTYAYPFPITIESELVITVYDTTGTKYNLALTTDYTVTGEGSSSGGNVVLVDADQAWLTGANLTTSWVINIRRVVALTQTAGFRNQGSFLPAAHENALDKLTKSVQQIKTELDRAIKVPAQEADSFTGEISGLASARASKYLTFDASGNPTATSTLTTGSVSVSSFMETVLDDTTAGAARTTLGFTGASGTVAAGNIEADAVTTAKILDLNVTTGKLAANAVTTAKITDANVTAAKLAEAAWALGTFYGGASAAGTDTYAVTPSPAFTAYATGMTIVFKADVANTGGATLNVNGLGAKTLTDTSGTALETGAIVASQMVQCVYDGTNFQVTSPLARPNQFIKAWVVFDASSGTPTISTSFNVTSITDNGVGNFTINFTTAFANANYAVSGMAGNDDATNQCVVGFWGVGTKTTTACQVRVYNLTATIDAKIVTLIFLGAR